jgi:hypothetical protein
MVASPASASLVFDPTATSVLGQGFGNVPRDLTIQANGSNHTTTESGCVAVTSGATISIGSSACLTSETNVHDGNGVVNGGGDEPPPLADNQKYGIPTAGSLGWATAADIGLLFNATDPGGNGLDLTDVTLKFYDANGNLLAAIDGQHTFGATDIGNGGAGFIFDVDASEQTYLNGVIFNGSLNLNNVYMALESTIVGGEGGPESWTIFNLNHPPAVPEPATWAMMLLGFCGIGMAMRRRHAKAGGLLQIA